MIYRLILAIRNTWYRNPKHVRKAEVPTICVGNITVGGTGKTPHTEMILRTLIESDEWGARYLAVLSRGYKRNSRGFQQVVREGSASFYGDEPLQLKKKFPGVTVAVDKDRIEGCDLLCHPEKLLDKEYRGCRNPHLPQAELVVLDDAFQYRKLQADLNIVLVDWNRPVTKDSLLPFGRLRDLPSRLYDADIVIVSKCPYDLEDEEKEGYAKLLGYKDYQPAFCSATAPGGRTQALLFTTIRYEQPVPVYETSDPRYIYSKKLILFTGIAGDTPLRRYLSDNYKIVQHIAFPDHHRYTDADFRAIRAAVRQHPTAAVATTEKDAQRVLDYNGMPQALRERMFQVPISVEFSSVREREIFKKALCSLAGN